MEGIASGVVQGIVSPLMEKLVIPKIQLFFRKVELDYKKDFVPIQNHFKEYFERTYEKLSYINTIALKNSQKKLKDIYIPLSLVSGSFEKESFKVEGYPKTILNKYRKVLITDTAGMGKSTLMKRIYLDIIDGLYGIPLFVELRRLSGKKTIMQEIQEQFDAINKSFDTELLFDLLADGGFIVILDGYDEISIEERNNVYNDIQSFIEKAHNNLFIMTSRPEQSLAGFGSFQEFNILPLEKEEAYLLLKKYDKSGDVSTLLINKIQDQSYSNISEFLTNPFLTSLLYTAFEYKQTIPLKKNLFYRQIFDAYFESHDLSKGDSYVREKNCKLGIDEFETVLRYLAILSFNNKQKIEYTKDELLKFLNKVKEKCVGFTFVSSAVIKDLTTTVPLFTIDGVYYKWTHKSLYEYFTAQFIYKDSGDRRSYSLTQLYNSDEIENFMNILDLYYDIDFKSFRNTIIYELLKEYSLYNNTEYNQIYNGVELSAITRRKELCFLNKYPFLFKINDVDDEYDTNKVTDMLARCAQKAALNETRWSAIITKSLPDKVLCLHYCHEKMIILRLLNMKKNKLVKQLDNLEIPNNKKYILNFNFKKVYYPYRIDDKPQNKLNSKANFAVINAIMELTNYLYPYILDNKEALLELKRIESELDKDLNEDFFIK